jgi:hypothetical protein
MCAKIATAVRGLKLEYGDKVRLQVVPRTRGDKAMEAEIDGFDIGSHGLVAISAEAQVLGKIPGHQFGQAEILAELGKLLGKP